MNREHPRGCDQKIRALSQSPAATRRRGEVSCRGHAESLKVCPGLFQSGHVRVDGYDAAVIFSQRCQMGGLSAWCGTCVQNALAGERAEKWGYELGSASLNGKKALPVTGKKLDGSTDSPNFHCIRLGVDRANGETAAAQRIDKITGIHSEPVRPHHEGRPGIVPREYVLGHFRTIFFEPSFHQPERMGIVACQRCRVTFRTRIYHGPVANSIPEDRVDERSYRAAETWAGLFHGFVHGSVVRYTFEKKELIYGYSEDFFDLRSDRYTRPVRAATHDGIEPITPPKDAIGYLGGKTAILRRKIFPVENLGEGVFSESARPHGGERIQRGFPCRRGGAEDAGIEVLAVVWGVLVSQVV